MSLRQYSQMANNDRLVSEKEGIKVVERKSRKMLTILRGKISQD
jgi:hypothetical protein